MLLQRSLKLAAIMLLLFGAAQLSATPLTMYYEVTPNGNQYDYSFELILDNNDNSWSSGQGFGWLIFGDRNSAGTNSTGLQNFTMTSGIPGPWTSLGSTGGGHNGPSFNYVLDTWVPTALNQSLTWTGRASNYLQQGQLLWSNIYNLNGARGANFEVATEIQPVEADITAGTREMLYADDTGGGDGVEVGSFTLENPNASARTITDITIRGSGTNGADFALAWSEFAIYRDAVGGTIGSYDTGDTMVGTGTFSGTPDEATVSVAQNAQDLAAAETATYFIVVKLSGIAVPAQTFDFVVQDFTVSSGSKSGLPTMSINGFEILAPELTAADNSSTNRPQALLGSDGHVLQEFTLSYPAGPDNTVTTLTITAGGTGDDSVAYDSVALFEDDGDGAFDAQLDARLDSNTFTADDGTLDFAITGTAADFTATDVKRYFVVADFNFSANNGDVFGVQLTGISGVTSGTSILGTPAPTAGVTAGVEILGNVLISTLNNSPGGTIDNDSTGPNGAGEVLLDFTLFSTNAAWDISGLTFRAGGTGDDMTAYTELALWIDTNGNDQYDGVGLDTMLGTAGTFNADDGTWEARPTALQIMGANDERFFLVGSFAGTATSGETFNVLLESIDDTPPQGGFTQGIPTAASGDFVIDAPAFDVTLNGPLAAQSVNNNATNVLLLDFTVDTTNDNFDISSFTFTASGTGDDAAGIMEVALYEDADMSGAFEFANDTLATNVAGAFSANDGDYVAMLTDTDFAGPSSRRFFLVATLAGTALSGETFNASLSALSSTSSTSTLPNGVPGMTSTAIMIDNPVLTVANSMTAPGDTVIEKSGGDFAHTMAKFVLTASNGDIALDNMTINMLGTGDWLNDVSATTGVQLFLDDGDDALDDSADTLLFEGPGMTGPLAASFAEQTITNGTTITIFARANFVAAAGGSTPSTYVLSINTPANISVGTGVNVLLGTPAPTSATMTLIEYFVTSVTPTRVAPGTFDQSIEIVGSGFTSPVSLTIDGVAAGGSGTVSPDGTMITGFTVPEHMGVNLEIVLSTGLLGQRTLTSTFSYASPKESGGGCSLASGTDNSALLLLLAAACCSLLVLRLRSE